MAEIAAAHYRNDLLNTLNIMQADLKKELPKEQQTTKRQRTGMNASARVGGSLSQLSLRRPIMHWRNKPLIPLTYDGETLAWFVPAYRWLQDHRIRHMFGETAQQTIDDEVHRALDSAGYNDEPEIYVAITQANTMHKDAQPERVVESYSVGDVQVVTGPPVASLRAVYAHPSGPTAVQSQTRVLVDEDSALISLLKN